MSDRIKKFAAIRRYFGTGEGTRPVELDELKALSKRDAIELGAAAATELGLELEE